MLRLDCCSMVIVTAHLALDWAVIAWGNSAFNFGKWWEPTLDLGIPCWAQKSPAAQVYLEHCLLQAQALWPFHEGG